MTHSFPSRRTSDLLKITSGPTTKGHHDSYLICAGSEQEMEEWIAAIENATFSNPYQQLLEERKRKQQQPEPVPKPAPANGTGGKEKKKEKKKNKIGRAHDQTTVTNTHHV